MIYSLYGLLLVAWIFMANRLIYAFTHFRIKKRVDVPLNSNELPTVSVCIPARNEMYIMTECLELVLASNYPKLEIIVLDDSSGDNTSVLIKSFAHEGVRFVEGKKLTGAWLGKNHALQELADEASGSYIFFMDVDTRIKPDTIKQLISYMRQEDVDMVSVLPRRDDDMRPSVLFSSLRYFWEIMFHRKAAPSTASNAWIIRRETLEKEFGGFESFKSAIQPETKLSASLMPKNKYRFLMASKELGVSYEKKWTSQVETSIRLLFPLLGGKVWLSILSLLGLLILLIPTFILAQALVYGWSYMQTFMVILFGLYALLYGAYSFKTWSYGWWLGALLWPVIVLQEYIILLVSIERYLRHDVTWKGRPISLPVVND